MSQPNQQLQTKTQTAVALRSLVEQPAYQNRFKELLRDRAPQFVASLVQLVNATEQLQKCEPNSIIAAAVTAAAMDLPIEKNFGFAWIIPYGTQAQFQMGYKGYIQLAIRTGEYKFINVTEVYEGELDFHNRMTSEIILKPENKRSDKIVGYAAYFKLVNGYEHAEYWDVETVEAHAKRFSEAYRKGYNTPWKTDFDAMAMKTVIKSLLSHWGILSIQMRNAISNDGAIRATVESDPLFSDNTTAEPEVKQPSYPGKPQAQLPQQTQPPATAPAAEAPKRGRPAKVTQPTAPVTTPAPTTAPVSAPQAVPSEPESTEALFDNPPEPEPLQEAPVTGTPPTPPAASQSPELIALFGTMAMPHAQVSEAQVMQFCYMNKLAFVDKGQHHLSDLDPKKLVNLKNAIEKPTSPILAKIKSIAIDV